MQDLRLCPAHLIQQENPFALCAVKVDMWQRALKKEWSILHSEINVGSWVKEGSAWAVHMCTLKQDRCDFNSGSRNGFWDRALLYGLS